MEVVRISAATGGRVAVSYHYIITYIYIYIYEYVYIYIYIYIPQARRGFHSAGQGPLYFGYSLQGGEFLHTIVKS